MPPRPRCNEANRAAGAHPYRMRDVADLPAEIPACPFDLDARAQAAWDHMAPRLHERGLLTAAYGPALGLVARAMGDLEEAKARLTDTGGPVIEGRLGNRVTNPWAHEYQRASTNLRHLLTEFGLTPAARLKVQASPTKPPKGKDPMEEILG